VRAHYERIRDETKPSRSPSGISVA